MNGTKPLVKVILPVIGSVFLIAVLFLSFLAIQRTQQVEETCLEALNGMDYRLQQMEARLRTYEKRTASDVAPSMPSPQFSELGSGPAMSANGLPANGFGPPGSGFNPVHHGQIDARIELRKRNRQLHEADQQQYGAALEELYNKARQLGRRGNEGNGSNTQEDALMLLLAQYPKANATGMVLAERALAAARDFQTPDVVNFYQKLRTEPAFAGIVTDQGVDAIPTIQSFLIEQYLQEGQAQAAKKILEEFDAGNQNGFVIRPGPGNTMEFFPVKFVSQDLHTKLQHLNSEPDREINPQSREDLGSR